MGGKCRAIKEKMTWKKKYFPTAKFGLPLSSRWEGGLMALSLKKNFFATSRGRKNAQFVRKDEKRSNYHSLFFPWSKLLTAVSFRYLQRRDDDGFGVVGMDVAGDEGTYALQEGRTKYYDDPY